MELGRSLSAGNVYAPALFTINAIPSGVIHLGFMANLPRLQTFAASVCILLS